MDKKGQTYLRKEKILISDTMYEVLTSPLLQRIYGTEDPAEIAFKIFEESMKERIKRGEFEGKPGCKEIYQAFGVRPESKPKKI